MYVWRTVFAGVLLGWVYWYVQDRLAGYSSSMQMLGSGRWIFGTILYWLALAVFFGMPLLTCGSIVSERERNTLSLLLTTQISPRELVYQKLASRLYVMLTLVMVALPLMARAYSLGGVTGDQIIDGIVAIVSLSVLTGSFSLLQSVRAASAVGALASTIVWMSFLSMITGGFMMAAMAGNTLFGALFGATISFTISALFLFAAARRIPQAALEPPRSRLLAAFRKTDRFFSTVNKGFGGIEFLRDRAVLPGDEPIFWRERYKRALGQTHHLVRIIALLETPTVLIVTLVMTAGRTYRNPNPLGWFLDFLWIVAVLVVALRTVGIWPLERSRETLDVLLTTPMSGRDLVDQSMRGVRRSIIAVSVPIATVQLATFLIQPPGAGRWYYLFGSVLSLVTVLPVTAWAAMLIGLRMKSQLRATLVVGGLFFAIVVVPRAAFPAAFDRGELFPILLRAAIDPGLLMQTAASTLSTREFEFRSAFMITLVLSALTAWMHFLIWLLRRSCLINVSAWLGREERVGRNFPPETNATAISCVEETTA